MFKVQDLKMKFSVNARDTTDFGLILLDITLAQCCGGDDDERSDFTILLRIAKTNNASKKAKKRRRSQWNSLSFPSGRHNVELWALWVFFFCRPKESWSWESSIKSFSPIIVPQLIFILDYRSALSSSSSWIRKMKCVCHVAMIISRVKSRPRLGNYYTLKNSAHFLCWVAKIK